MGNNLDLMLHYIHNSNKTTKNSSIINTCIWVPSETNILNSTNTSIPIYSELKDDAYLIFGSEDSFIYIISVKRSKVIQRLAGLFYQIIFLNL